MTLSDSLPNLLLFREHDQLFLGDILTPQTSALTPAKLLLVKQVCMFAGYTTVLDIVTADSLCIRKEAWDLSESRDSYCLHPYNWPSTPPRLTAKHKQAWQLGLSQALLQSHTVLRRLQQPLGHWQRTPHRWPWCYNQQLDPQVVHLHMHQSTPYQTVYHKRQGLRQRYYPFHTEPQSSTVAHLQLATIQHTPGLNITLVCHTEIPSATPEDDSESLGSSLSRGSSTPPPDTLNNLEVALQALPTERHWMVEDLQHSDAGLILLEALTSGTAIACSDGSYHLSISSSAFTLQGSTAEGRIDAVNQIPGDTDDQTSYRAKLGGICGIISVLEALLLAYPHIRTLRLTITISLDNASAIISCQHSHPPRPDQPCYDLLLDIFYPLKALPIEVTWHKVEGHMKEKGKVMDRWAVLNDQMDSKAKQHLRRCQGTPRPNLSLPTSRIQHRGKILSRVHIKTLYKDFTSSDLAFYWAKKTGMNPEADEFIDWQSFGRAKQTIPAGLDCWLLEHCSGHCSTAYKLKQRRQLPHSRCPLCEAPVENIRHLLRCSDQRATTTWNEQLLSLEAWLKKAYTHPSIRILILKGLKHWRSTETDYPPQPTQPDLIYQCTLEQFDIGWFNFLLGRIAKHWALAQDAHYKSLCKRHTGQSWAKGLIVELWTLNWKILEHRNTRKHTEDTPEAQATLEDLKDQVRREFQLGPSGMLQQDQQSSAITVQFPNSNHGS